MQTCDAIVIGGGPAGSSCAWKLVGAGMHVLVIDKSTFPRDKVCAGWITPAVLEELEIDVDEYRRGRTFQTITGFRTSLLGGREIDTKYDGSISYGIRRSEFDHFLLERSGARLALGTALQGLRRDGPDWIVNEAFRSPVIIGAGGHFCPVARRLEDGAKRAATVATKEIEFRLTAEQAARCSVAPEVPELYFLRELDGYGWCFRKGDYLNVGVGRIGARDIPKRVERLVEFLISSHKVPPDIPTAWRGHAYLLYGARSRRMVGDGVMLVGDAAGLAYPQSGEGIRTAVESGLLAASILLEARGRYDREALHPYVDALRRRFGDARTSAPAGPVTAVIASAVGRALMATRWFTRRVVLDRWFLHSGQPSLRLS